MSEPRIYGHNQAGRPITDTEVEAFAAEAEAGYDVDELIARRPKRGRPALGSSPASVESVRLDPELHGLDARRRGAQRGTTPLRPPRDQLIDVVARLGLGSEGVYAGDRTAGSGVANGRDLRQHLDDLARYM